MIHIPLGAQLRDGKSAGWFILFLLITMFLVFFYVTGEYVVAAPLTLFQVLFIFFILDIQGVQIDLKNDKIRTYKLYLWGKKGQWKKLSDYEELTVNQYNFNVTQRTLFTQLSSTRPYENRHATISESHFVVQLSHKDDPQQNIYMGEENSYSKIIKRAKNLSEEIQMPVNDLFKERLKKMKSRRRG